MQVIQVSAVVMRDPRGYVLNVRKRGTTMLMLPGGKPELIESPAETAIREFREELGIGLDPALLEPLGEFRAAAANEPGHVIVAHVFEHPFVAGACAHAEIDHLEWIHPSAPRADLAPLTIEYVFPALLEQSAHFTPPSDELMLRRC
jgi:8-oxo-dGTP pyrophosphatase MutT (NUDIX family)